jgi:hypothetical protein
MESTPVSRASLETRCGGIRLQSCPSTLSLDAVGLVFLFFTSAEWQSQRAMPTTFFLCFNAVKAGVAKHAGGHLQVMGEVFWIFFQIGPRQPQESRDEPAA